MEWKEGQQQANERRGERVRGKDVKSKQTIEALNVEAERSASQSTSLVNTQLEISDRSSSTPDERADRTQLGVKDAQSTRDMAVASPG